MNKSSLLVTLAFATSLMACGDASNENTGNSASSITAAAYPQTGYVTYLYRTVLGREPDKAGLDAAVSQLVTGGCNTATLGQLVKGIFLSAEFQNRTLIPMQRLELLYQATFYRYADTQGLLYWHNQLEYGALSFSQIIEYFIATKEFDGLTPSRCTP